MLAWPPPNPDIVLLATRPSVGRTRRLTRLDYAKLRPQGKVIRTAQCSKLRLFMLVLYMGSALTGAGGLGSCRGDTLQRGEARNESLTGAFTYGSEDHLRVVGN